MTTDTRPEIMYHPTDVGKEVQSSRGNVVTIRKYHMSPEEMETQRKKWIADLEASKIPPSVKRLAHPLFFNPFRQGVYYAEIQALYILGANRWHELSVILPKIQEIMMGMSVVQRTKGQECTYTDAWKMFKEKAPKSSNDRSKDIIGRIQENFVFFQRLTRLHPCGYKLRQVGAALDIRRVSSKKRPNGVWYYMLHTYETEAEAWPTRDYSKFDLTKGASRFVTYKFIGKIITADKTVFQGIEQAKVSRETITKEAKVSQETGTEAEVKTEAEATVN